MADIAPLQPLTLAAFLPWGSSEGAGRVSRCKIKKTFLLYNQNLTFFQLFFNHLFCQVFKIENQLEYQLNNTSFHPNNVDN